MQSLTPVLRIDSAAKALAHYVDWLGFELDWEWREAPGRPAILSISRDDISIMLNEADDVGGKAWLTVAVDDLQALAEEWNRRRPGSAKIEIGPPYEIPSVWIEDPSGNRIDFQQPVSTQEQALRDERGERMRELVRGRLDAGEPCPTPESLVEACGRPIGLAIQVLGEFPEYRPDPDGTSRG